MFRNDGDNYPHLCVNWPPGARDEDQGRVGSSADIEQDMESSKIDETAIRNYSQTSINCILDQINLPARVITAA